MSIVTTRGSPRLRSPASTRASGTPAFAPTAAHPTVELTFADDHRVGGTLVGQGLEADHDRAGHFHVGARASAQVVVWGVKTEFVDERSR